MKTTYWLPIFTSLILILSVIRHLLFTSNFGDASFRFSPTDSPINMFAFFWTNFWYIPAFFCVLCLVTFKTSLIPHLLFSLVLAPYLYEAYDLSSCSWASASLPTFQLSLNTLLTNSINKYHPLIFYLGVSLLFRLYLFLLQASQSTFASWSNRLITYNILNQPTIGFFVTLVALYLGSWWALQEGTWGGWWNWDASETFGFFLALAFIRWVHLFSIRGVTYSLYISVRLFTFLFAVMYFMMQLNFDLISHNFGIKFFFFFNNSLFLLEMLFFFLLLTLYTSHQYFYIRKKIPTSTRLKTDLNFKRSLLATLSYLLVAWIFLASFGPVLSYFSWTYARLNIFNELGVHVLSKLSYAMVILSFYFLSFHGKPHFYILLLFSCTSNVMLISFVLLRWATLTNQLHNTLLLFLITGLEAPSTQLAYTLLKAPVSIFSPVIYPVWLGVSSFVLDETSYYSVSTNYPTNSLSFVCQTFLTTPSTMPLFGFFIGPVVCTSSLLNIAELFTYVNFIEVNSTNTYPFIVFVGLFYSFWVLLKRSSYHRF